MSQIYEKFVTYKHWRKQKYICHKNNWYLWQLGLREHLHTIGFHRCASKMLYLRIRERETSRLVWAVGYKISHIDPFWIISESVGTSKHQQKEADRPLADLPLLVWHHNFGPVIMSHLLSTNFKQICLVLSQYFPNMLSRWPELLIIFTPTYYSFLPLLIHRAGCP